MGTCVASTNIVSYIFRHSGPRVTGSNGFLCSLSTWMSSYDFVMSGVEDFAAEGLRNINLSSVKDKTIFGREVGVAINHGLKTLIVGFVGFLEAFEEF